MGELDSRVVVLESEEEQREPSDEEVAEYAAFLGIDPEEEQHLMWVAREGVSAPVPHPWKACHNLEAEHDDEIFYFNFETAESVWDHPCDDMFRNMVEEERAKSRAIGGPKEPVVDGAAAGPDVESCGGEATLTPTAPTDAQGDRGGGVAGSGKLEVTVAEVSDDEESSDSSAPADCRLSTPPAAATSAGTPVVASGGDAGGSGPRVDSSVRPCPSSTSLAQKQQEHMNPAAADENFSASSTLQSPPAAAIGTAGSNSVTVTDGTSKIASNANDEAQRRRLRLITDEISEDSISEDSGLPEDSSTSGVRLTNSRLASAVNARSPNVPGQGGQTSSAAGNLSGVPQNDGGAAAAGAGRGESADGTPGPTGRRSLGVSLAPAAAGPTFRPPARGLAGVGLAPARAAAEIASAVDHGESEEPGAGAQSAGWGVPDGPGSQEPGAGPASATAAEFDASSSQSQSGNGGAHTQSTSTVSGGGGFGSGNAGGRSLPGSVAKKPGIDLQLDHSGHSALTSSGRSMVAGSSGASEVSEELVSEFEVTSPGASQLGVGHRASDTLELSATVEPDESSLAAAAAAAASAAAPAAVAGFGDVGASEVKLDLTDSEEARDPKASSRAQRWRSLGSQVESLARSLTMLRDIRHKQKEYLQLLQASL